MRMVGADEERVQRYADNTSRFTRAPVLFRCDEALHPRAACVRIDERRIASTEAQRRRQVGEILAPVSARRLAVLALEPTAMPTRVVEERRVRLLGAVLERHE